LLPVALDARHWYVPVAWPLAIALLVLAGTSVVFAVKSAVRQPARSGLVVGVTLSLLSLVPVSLVGPNQQIYGDRFASLFVLGLAVAGGAVQPLLSWLRVRWQWMSAAALIGCWSLLTLLRGAEWASEERLITSALAEHPEHPDWRVLQSHRFLTQGNPQAAIESLSEITQANPGYAKAWNALCVAYLRTQQTRYAQDACHKALQLDSNSPSAWVNWSTVQVAQRNWPQAIDAADRALQIRRIYPEAQYLVAISLAQLGQLVEAEQHVMRGLADAPKHAGLNDLKRQLEQRRAH
jgi:tetratricopeptide (TPR) repeat protein